MASQRSLIGTSLDQVSTNAMLGTLAFQDADGAYIETIRGAVGLEGLSKDIVDSAVDIFVYDTRKDSDGGAWRKRCQHTSWYNETLNTATRGSRREFPAVAVIVSATSSNRLTIYDGDDPNLPMWMVFTGNPSQYGAVFNNRNVISVVAINGSIYWADSLDSVVNVSFIKDNYTSTAVSGSWNSSRNILDRNPADTNNLWTQYDSSRKLVAYPLNDVAITILPNAPIDPSTGLPVPTIAVATDGGVSVIRDDGQVFDLTFSGQNGSKVFKVTFDDKHQICMLLGYSNIWPYTSYIYHVPSSDVALSAVTDRVLNNTTYNFPSDAYGAQNTSSGDINDYIDSKYFGTDKGMSFLTPNKNDIGGQLICHINTEFNSGWQHGDIKGAFLADTDGTSVTGTELVTNGTFDTDTTGWTVDGVTATVSSGEVTMVGSGDLTQLINVVSGETYVISANVISIANCTANLKINTNSTGAGGTVIENRTNAGSLSGTFVALASTMYIAIQNGSADGSSTSTWDNVSVRLAEPDRSVNAKGLQVFGTITKSPVATGAELVAYSGWSTSNYLEQPYNSDFNLTSTQDASWIVWFKNTESAETYYHFFDSGYVLDSMQHYWLVGLLGSGDGRPTFRLNGNTQLNLNGVGNYLDGLWHQIIVTRTGNGTLISMYIDGQLSSTLSTSSLEITHSTNAKLRIGLRGETDNRPNTGGYLTQLRFSKSAPTPDQIKKIYEDEKVLFQENAACTLYGSSDAVTALAYDEDTELLHVGTASGRSEFKGLRRVGNTTTAVTTAISASNGLIAEQ